MQWTYQTFSHLTTHRNWQKHTTHPFLACHKQHWSDLLKQCDTLACTLQKGHVFSGFAFHLVKNVYHNPGPPAPGHLIFADSAHSRSLPHPSVKSREQTQSKFSILQKTVLFVCLFRKQYLVIHSNLQNLETQNFLVLFALDSRTCTKGWEASPSN